MKKHLLIYDIKGWIFDYRAHMIQKYHPNLDILSLSEMNHFIKKEGAHKVNRSYEVISTLGLDIAAFLLTRNVRVDTSQVGGYNFFTKNMDNYREWCDQLVLNKKFIKEVLRRIGRLGTFNPKLVEVLKSILPDQDVRYIRPFIDTNHFKPSKKNSLKQGSSFNIGWAGNKARACKNYNTLYLPIVEAFKSHPRIKFMETTMGQRSIENMPDFYNRIDLLMVTSANEGAPNPALEAYSCGVPVLSTNVGYVKTVAHKDARSLILDSDRPKDFIRKIDFLASHPDVLNEIKKGCRDNVLKKWTIEKTMGDWLKILFNI